MGIETALIIAGVGAAVGGAAVAFAPGPDAPPPRNITKEMETTLRSEITLAPEQYAAEAEWSPKYAALGRKNFEENLFGPGGKGGMLDIAQRAQVRIDQIASESNERMRSNDIADLKRLGPGAVEAIRNANPEQKALIMKLNREAMGLGSNDPYLKMLKGGPPFASRRDRPFAGLLSGTANSFGAMEGGLPMRQNGGLRDDDGGGAMGGYDPLVQEMRDQAQRELALGSGLDAATSREVQQNIRAAQAARGMGMGGGDMYQEAMGLGSAGEALRQQRRAFAGGVVTMSGQDKLARQLAYERNLQQSYGLQGNIAGINAASAVDPMLAILGRPSGSYQPALAQGGQYTGDRFDTMNPYAADLYNTNYNGEAAANIAGSNQRAAIAGSLIGAAGSIGGSYFNSKNTSYLGRR